MTVTLVRPAPSRLRCGGAAGLIRVRPAPALDPPYDDEPGGSDLDPFAAGPDRDGSDEPVPGGPRAPGEAHQVTRRFLDLSIEVLDGFRPMAHLRAFTEPSRFDELAGQLGRLGQPRWSAARRPGMGLVRLVANRLRLRHLRVCEIRPGVVESAAVLARGEQVRAVALRLERRAGAWLCTHLEVL